MDNECVRRKSARENYKLVDGLYFHKDTPSQVCSELLKAYNEGYRVRLFFGSPFSGICWNEMYDIMGTVRCSTGPIKTPILVHSRASSGGPAILTHCIIRIVRISDKKVLYTHRAFDYVNNYEVRGSEVYANGQMVVNAGTPERAEKCKEFMLGHRFTW